MPALWGGCVLIRPDVMDKTRPDCDGDFVDLDAAGFIKCLGLISAAGCQGFSFSGHNEVLADCRGSQCEPASCPSGFLSLASTSSATSAAPLTPSVFPFASHSLTGAEAVPASERAALIAFFNATGGPTNWFTSDKTNWLGAPGTECTWKGVLCDGAGAHVTGLFFKSYNLVGKLPKELGNLADLQWLVIEGGNSLTGPLPTELGNLKKLRALSLERTMVSGSLPASLGGLTSLASLRIASADLSGALPSALGNLKQLQVLQISATRIAGAIPPALGNLPKLSTLDLRLNELTGGIPSDLGKLTNLAGLFLGWNDLSGPIPSALGSLSKLRHLNLERNRLNGAIPASFGSLTNLETLTLDSNLITGAIPAGFSGLQKLRNLSIGFNALSGPLPAWLPNLSNSLEILYLPDNQFTGPMSDLSALGKLTDLHLAWNNLDPGPVPASLAAPALSKLSKLDLSKTRRNGPLPTLSSLPLTHLALGENSFDPGPIPAWIGAETTLKHLDLRATGRTGDIPFFLAGLDDLGSLFLGDNAFTPGPIPGFINRTELGRLANLSLDNTRRTGGLPIALFDLPLSSLRLARNQLTGTIPKEVQKPFLTVLDLSQNRLGGALPSELGSQVRMQSLRLNGNKFSGEIPAFYKSSLIDDDMIDGVISDEFGREFPGIDLRFNALTTSDPAMVTLLKQKHKGGVDFRATQTVAPSGLKATVLGKDSVKLSWTAIAFSAGAGSYKIEVGKTAAGPFTVAGTTANKAATSFTVTKLKAKTSYFFRLRTTSAASAENQSALTSTPSAVIKATTKN